MKVELFWERGSVPSIMMDTPDIEVLAKALELFYYQPSQVKVNKWTYTCIYGQFWCHAIIS